MQFIKCVQCISKVETTLTTDTTFHFLLATIVSAPSTDKPVNLVTPALFPRSPQLLAKAEPEYVEPFIQSLGLYHNKAKYLVNVEREIITNFNGEIPHIMKELTRLTGGGRKVANFVLAEYFHILAFPVDTPVSRIARCLGMVKPNATVLQIEKATTESCSES
ncbi:endonuclease III domain-containing protein [Limosilactobacillus fastidiosus]|uniref:endonuclease III domain-containing protein n=1 Tax=Limosilactobacillus fastidiosus TaxID=2759855 RepID=UPI001E4E5535|nr:endonuclease III [Limosilactobacillus fastidiosus]MCD7084131.1 endonuclease III [Limosilactobacillus fastidiosus]MCD7086486.1 endonuclease III [Limosilactobacillus fastidiosus]MCD7114644.1 endonuclease III [Limosilactobacillus fastidiosus]MCD7116505.1 endonuclease III [Limosilactobacillus fastidiosus]